MKEIVTITNSSLNEEYRNSPVNIIRYVPEELLINSCIGLIGSSVTYAVVLSPSQGLVDAVAAFAASSCRVLSVDNIPSSTDRSVDLNSAEVRTSGALGDPHACSVGVTVIQTVGVLLGNGPTDRAGKELRAKNGTIITALRTTM